MHRHQLLEVHNQYSTSQASRSEDTQPAKKDWMMQRAFFLPFLCMYLVWFCNKKLTLFESIIYVSLNLISFFKFGLFQVQPKPSSEDTNPAKKRLEEDAKSPFFASFFALTLQIMVFHSVWKVSKPTFFQWVYFLLDGSWTTSSGSWMGIPSTLQTP